MDNLLLVFAIVGFLAVVLLVEGAWLLWNSNRGAEAQRMRERLKLLTVGERLSMESELIKERLLSQSPALEQMLMRVPRVHALERMILQSGLQRTVGGVLVACVVAALLALLVWAFLPAPAWTAPLLALGAASAPFLQVWSARRKRLRHIEQQLPDALDLMSRALRAGHAFPSALQMVGDEGPEPIAREFRITFDEINYGVPMQDALNNLAARVPITDLRFFVIAVGIQRETGGNLAELLDKLARLMRERFKLLGTIRVLSSEGRLSAWILTLLPFVLVAVINLINPKFMSVLWRDPAGLIAVYISLALMALGIVWMWRIVKIRV
jgi:tight adherence protein B